MVENEWTQFGWYGICFSKPAEWELGKIEGDGQKGSLRIDDHMFNRIEMRWQKHPSNLPVDKILSKHIRTLEKKSKKQGIQFRILANRDYQNSSIKGKYFIWESDFTGVNVIAHSRKPSLLLLVCVLGRKGEHIEKKADRIFDSLQKHTNNVGKMFWSVFGFSFSTPAEFKLYSHKFLTGRLEFNFSQRDNTFLFERFSVANILLKEKSLSQYAIESCRNQFKNVDIEAGYPREGKTEEGIYTVGREFGRFKFLKKRFFKSLFWHCPKSNHIFGVIELIKKNETSSLDKLALEVKCH